MTSALIVVDVQESFRQRPLWQTVSQPDVVEQVGRLVQWARARGDLVVWVLHSEPGSGGLFDPVNGHVHVVDELAPEPGEPVLVKTSYNAFTTTNLQQTLVERGIRDLVVCGLRTEQCCETTTRIGCDLGFTMTFVTDATATFPAPHWSMPAELSVEDLLADPRTLATADIVSRTEYALAGRFATVVRVADLVASDPVGADPVVADPVVADPVGADLVVADLVVADLVVADLVVADLVVADLVVADLVEPAGVR